MTKTPTFYYFIHVLEMSDIGTLSTWDSSLGKLYEFLWPKKQDRKQNLFILLVKGITLFRHLFWTTKEMTKNVWVYLKRKCIDKEMLFEVLSREYNSNQSHFFFKGKLYLHSVSCLVNSITFIVFNESRQETECIHIDINLSC